MNESEWRWIKSNCFIEVYPSLSFNHKVDFVNVFLLSAPPVRFRDKIDSYERFIQITKGIFNLPDANINIVGSSKLGYSLAQNRFGEPFTADSDYDALIVSESLFKSLINDYQKWVCDILYRHIIPCSRYELRTWIDNLELIDNSIYYGYINSWYIPSKPQYTAKSRISAAIQKIIEANGVFMSSSKITFRVYLNWTSLERNLIHSLDNSIPYHKST